MRGWVYVLSDPRVTGEYKVGYAERDVVTRIEELYTTGLPHRLVNEFSVYVEKPQVVEAPCHQKLSEFRTTSNREFFRTDLSQIRIAIDQTIRELGLSILLIDGQSQDATDSPLLATDFRFGLL